MKTPTDGENTEKRPILILDDKVHWHTKILMETKRREMWIEAEKDTEKVLIKKNGARNGIFIQKNEDERKQGKKRNRWERKRK